MKANIPEKQIRRTLWIYCWDLEKPFFSTCLGTIRQNPSIEDIRIAVYENFAVPLHSDKFHFDSHPSDPNQWILTMDNGDYFFLSTKEELVYQDQSE